MEYVQLPCSEMGACTVVVASIQEHHLAYQGPFQAQLLTNVMELFGHGLNVKPSTSRVKPRKLNMERAVTHTQSLSDVGWSLWLDTARLQSTDAAILLSLKLCKNFAACITSRIEPPTMPSSGRENLGGFEQMPSA